MIEAEMRINKTKIGPKNHSELKKKIVNRKKEITIAEAIANCETAPIPTQLTDETLTKIKNEYKNNRLFREVISQPDKYKGFKIKNELLYYQNIKKEPMLCIPSNRKLIMRILSAAHEIVGHLGETKTSDYI